MNYKELENQLGELGKLIGYKYCILPRSIHDGSYLGVYDSNGDLMWDTHAANIEICINSFLEWIVENPQPKNYTYG